jgi:hypothetical protein
MNWQEILVVTGQHIVSRFKSFFTHQGIRVLFTMTGYILAAAVVSALVSSGLSGFLM